MADQTQASSPVGSEPDSDIAPSPMVSDPAELIRVASMLQALMAEMRGLTLDDPGRKRLYEIHRRAVDAIRELVSDTLEEELTELGVPIDDADATGPELRIAHAQLLGWLNGLFQGIQAAMAAQQMSAQQLRQLQPASEDRQPSDRSPGGQYL